MLVGLEEGVLVSGPDDVVAVFVKTLSGLDGRVGGIVGKRDVGELGVVGRGRGTSGIPRLKSIRVQVITGVLGDGVGEVPGVGQGEVVRGVGKTDGVLIEQGSERDGVSGRDAEGRGEDRGQGSVVGPLHTITTLEGLSKRDVLGLVGEENDGMGETKIERGTTGGDVLERSNLGLLDLVDEDVTRSITHLNTLVIVDDSVVSIGLNVGEGGELVVLGDTVDIGAHISNSHCAGGTGVDDNELNPVTEVVGDLHVVERKGGNGEGNTRVFAKEKGNGERQGSTTDAGAGADRSSIVGGHADHVEITLTLLAHTTPLEVIIQPVVVKLLDLEVVELDLNVTNQVVHKVVDPTDSRSRLGINGGLKANSGETSTKEGGENVITLARQGEARLASTELSSNTDVAKGDRNVREPVSLLN